MKERRNFYRILGVQPDASLRLIRSAWRTWMQKLQQHPDCGGDVDAAATLNAAYHVLRDPRRRAAYDRNLVRQWNDRERAASDAVGATGAGDKEAACANRRNYYRVLGVQAEVPGPIIDSAYRAAVEHAGSPRRLIEEAYWVIGDPDRRAAYDTWLARCGHAAAADLAQPRFASCLFCKAPHGEYPGAHGRSRCWNCTAPLDRADAGSNRSGRRFARSAADTALRLYESWPAREHSGRIVELTPAGLTVATDAIFEHGALLRLEADCFAAVAVVVYQSSRAAAPSRCGLQLLRADFNTSGVLLDARA